MYAGHLRRYWILVNRFLGGSICGHLNDNKELLFFAASGAFCKEYDGLITFAIKVKYSPTNVIFFHLKKCEAVQRSHCTLTKVKTSSQWNQKFDKQNLVTHRNLPTTIALQKVIDILSPKCCLHSKQNCTVQITMQGGDREFPISWRKKKRRYFTFPCLGWLTKVKTRNRI